VSLFLILILSGCGSGSSGSSEASTSHAPAVSNLVILPGEPGTFDISFAYSDEDGDVTTVAVALYDVKGTQLESVTKQIDTAGNTSGPIRGRLDLSDTPPGDYSIEIYITDSTGLQSNSISRSFSATGAVGQAANYQNPSDYLYLGDTAIGDLNGDGRNDVVAIQGSNNTGLLLIYYQNTTGELNSPIVTNLDINTRGVAIADVNNDGKADLVCSGLSKTALVGSLGRVAVFLQDQATGQLLPPHEYTVSSDHVFKIAVADLNSDDRNDVVVMAGQVGTSGNLSIFFQNNAGTLNPEVVYNKATIKFDGEIHTADMDNDGNTDIVVQSSPGEFAVILQITPGNFSSVPELYTMPSFNSFALGDVNGDGRIDMVATDPGSSYMNIFLQNSQGKLDPPVLVQINYGPFGVEVADITGDGLNDVIFDVSGGIVIVSQQSDHTHGNSVFYGYHSLSSGGSPGHQALSIGDVTGDGQLNAVVTWSDEGLYVFPYCAQLHLK
jgi:hypothetical protein